MCMKCRMFCRLRRACGSDTTFADASLNTRSDVRGVSEMTKNQGECDMARLSLSGKTPRKRVKGRFRLLG